MQPRHFLNFRTHAPPVSPHLKRQRAFNFFKISDGAVRLFNLFLCAVRRFKNFLSFIKEIRGKTELPRALPKQLFTLLEFFLKAHEPFAILRLLYSCLKQGILGFSQTVKHAFERRAYLLAHFFNHLKFFGMVSDERAGHYFSLFGVARAFNILFDFFHRFFLQLVKKIFFILRNEPLDLVKHCN